MRLKIDVEPNLNPRGTYHKDTYWLVNTINGEVPSLDAKPEGGRLELTVREDDSGVPCMVFIERGFPLYEAWVYHEGQLIAVGKGLV